MSNLPKITKKEQEIVRLLYSFRFLNRKQIQALLGHKDYKTINMWLRDLREKQYIDWIYSTHYAERTKPAIYFLSLNGIRYLRQFARIDDYDDEVPFYPPEELRKRYKEPKRSKTFIDHSVLVAECCVALKRFNSDASRHFFQTEADYIPETSSFNFILERDFIRPSLCVCTYRHNDADKPKKTLRSCILEVFDATQPRYIIRSKLTNYMRFLEDQVYDWMDEVDCQKLPDILFVVPGLGDLIYVKRKLRRLVSEAWEYKDDDEPRPLIKLTTIDQLNSADFLRADIWEKV